MIRLLAKYAEKLVAAGLSPAGGPVFAGLDDTLVFNRQAPETRVLAGVFDRMNITALLFMPPAEPYRTAIDFLAGRAGAAVEPGDCETRTFLHDLPVVRAFDPDSLARALRRRKSAIVPGRGVVAHATVSPEQAFVTASSVGFSCFVKFFADYLDLARRGRLDPAYRAAFARAVAHLSPVRRDLPPLAAGPFTTPEAARAAMVQAGRATVEYGLVDSYFGNISYCLDGVVHISQTGSSLDELEEVIDPCPLDGSTCAGITASSELSAHQAVVLGSATRAILHGHPRFSVILSMDCPEPDCPTRGRCHVECDRKRLVADIPVVPGEVGTGPRGLVNTLPGAMPGRRGVLVYGHGLFAVGGEDFRKPFDTLLSFENFCREEYFRRVARAGG